MRLVLTVDRFYICIIKHVGPCVRARACVRAAGKRKSSWNRNTEVETVATDGENYGILRARCNNLNILYGVHNGLTARRSGLQEKQWRSEYKRARTDGSTATAKIKASFPIRTRKRLRRVAEK